MESPYYSIFLSEASTYPQEVISTEFERVERIEEGENAFFVYRNNDHNLVVNKDYIAISIPKGDISE